MGSVRVKHLCGVIDERAGSRRPPLLAVSIHHGVVPRSALTDDEPRADDLSGYKLCEPGDLVLNRMRAFQGAIGMTNRAGMVSPDYLVLRPGPKAEARFLHYLFRSTWFVGEMVARLRGIGSVDTGMVRTPRINAEDLFDIRVAQPSRAEQRAIADYLDRETARIDALIEAKRRIMALLEEREQIENSELTSSSLNGATKLTTSAWYPRIPEHWRLATVGQVTRLIADGPHVSPDYTDETGVPFLSVRNVVASDWDLSSAKYISERNFEVMSRRVCPELGDVLLTKGGTTGVARVVDIPTRFQVWVHVAVLKLRRELVEPDYLAAALNSYCGAAQSKLGTRGATNQDLALGRIAKIEIALPPLGEQRMICVRIRDRQAYHRKADDMLERQVCLLQEHRQALICSAVIGQLEIPVPA